MAQIVPKLNLNKTPQLVDNHSLIFAKNVRLNANGLSPDYGFIKVYDNLLSSFDIVGIIPYNTLFYVLMHTRSGVTPVESRIYQYDELATTDGERFKQIPTRWTYSGGKIDGECSVNLRGDILLTIAEKTPGIPIKTINITEHLKNGITGIDESFYTQAPKIPLYHLTLDSLYNKPIPAGTYQFFIRYELYEDCYTDWFPASKELFAGYSKTSRTNQGGLKYIDTKVDSSFSFKFIVSKIYNPNLAYKSFQLGFIIAHDDEVYARAYKHFPITYSEQIIYFDYDPEYIEEIDIKDLLYSTYDVYNVGNITEYKNKLYISNYEETDFNPDSNVLRNFASSIQIYQSYKDNLSVQQYTDGTPITVSYHTGIPYISEINGTAIDSIVRSILTTNSAVLQNTTSQGFLDYTDNHVRVSIAKSIIELDPEGGGEVIDGGDEPEEPVDEKFHLFYMDTGDDLGDTGSINPIIGSIVAKTKYIIATTGAFRPDTTMGSSVFFKLTYNKVQSNKTYNCVLYIRFYTDTQNININSSIEYGYTLMPYQSYKFYVHFVTEKGEITNGYPINNSPFEVSEISNAPVAAIYPVFSNIGSLPSGYKAFFISILHTNNLVAQVFDIHNISSVNVPSKTIADCLELDTMLYTGLSGLTVKVNGASYLADYKASYDSSYPITFGSSGKLVFQDKLTNAEITQANGRGFLIMPYEANPKYAVLTKCTPWIIPGVNTTSGTYNNYLDLNLLSYLCDVKKPLDNLDKYYSGSDVYLKTVTGSDAAGYTISMKEFQAAQGTDSSWLYELLDSNSYIIYSNFNLNFLALTNNITERIVSKTDNGSTNKYLFIAFDSILLSEVYNLPSMYYSYTRKTYFTADDKSITKFTNTIRSSALEGDEAKVYRYKFLATDYYNVPTDKGIIVNLVAVGDNILVHTQDSIYKFSGQNSLTASGGEDVQMKESEVFDTGIQELFGSEFGYAGLVSKDHQILSEFGYTFWDRDSGRIYLYTGNAQMKVLSDDISKLLRRNNITNIYLADDYYNNRIFICVNFEDGKIATLSYDFVAKSFISLHEFKFDWAFKTKTKCYFVGATNNKYNAIYKIGTEIGNYSGLAYNDTLYPSITNSCIVDVIYNDRFEAIKTLNSISWICNKIVSFSAPISNNPKSLLVAEENFEITNPEVRYKGNKLRIYTDSCATESINIVPRSNDSPIGDAKSYTRVRYNLGKWTFNYFRNILNIPNEETETDIPPFLQNYGQDSSLIYGKYIVARFVFNRTTNFKFEDVTFNVTNDYNV